MILVTVGTSSFDDLVSQVDALVRDGHITDEVYAQIGVGTFLPHNIRQFRRFVPSLDNALDRASLVISHAGVGTCMEVLKRGIPLIVVPNKDVLADHQQEIVAKIEQEGWAIVCDDVTRLLECYNLSKSFRAKPCPVILDEHRLDFQKVLEEVMK